MAIPGKLVCFSNTFQNLMRAKFSVNGVNSIATLDTGASHSIISEDLLQLLNLELIPSTESLRVVGDNNISIVGKCSAFISTGDIDLGIIHLLVIKNKSEFQNLLLIGIDFMTNNRLEICPANRKLIQHYTDGGFIEFYLDQGGDVTTKFCQKLPCFSNEDVKIKKGEACKLTVNWCNIALKDNELLMYSDDDRGSSKGHLMSMSGIYDTGTNHVICYASEGDVMNKKGQQVGYVSSMVELPNQSEEEDVDQSWNLARIRREIGLPLLSSEQQEQVHNLVFNFCNVLQSDNQSIQPANVTEHHITLYDHTPIYQRPRRFPAPITNEIERQCNELCISDIIEPSISPYSSPIVPVRKKDGSIRLCIDYRKLNAVTIPDKFPVPNLIDSLFSLHGTQFFTSLDLHKGYYQIPLDIDSRPCTAFSTPKNHWQFKRLPFGLRNAPSAFQREIQAVLSAFPSNKVIVYIDDILIMGNSFQEHFDLVSKVLTTLQNYHIKINPTKCRWFSAEVEYLGHNISRSGVTKTEKFIERIKNYPRSTNVGELREFLGLINFQRKYIPNCSEIQKPLSELTGGRRRKMLTWTPEMTTAFNKLIELVQVELELAYPDYGEGASKLELWVDASATGAGACLAQEQGDSHRVIGYASMAFSSAQLNYSTLDRELAALRWGIRTFRAFIYGVEFILYTDHQPLVYLHNMKLVCNRLARTVVELADYVFVIKYVPGRFNCAADALSRLKQKVLPAGLGGEKAELPDGLIMAGDPAPGRGDSVFISLFRLLSKFSSKFILKDHLQLRIQLIDELIKNSSKYKFQLDKHSRRELNLMKHSGQLPYLEVLLAASRLYNIKIFVYFWSSQPVIYQFNSFCNNNIYLQCISGVHFNPLLPLQGYSEPKVMYSDIVTICSESLPASKPNYCYEIEEDENLPNVFKQLFYVENSQCDHQPSNQPSVNIDVFDATYCAILDTGAEISLISQKVIDNILQRGIKVGVTSIDNNYSIVGLTGATVAIRQVASLSFKIGSFQMGEEHRFAIIPDHVMPFCLLLGLDFITKFP